MITLSYVLSTSPPNALKPKYHDFGLRLKKELKEGAVPSIFKRKAADTKEPVAKKPAYEKRERLRVIK